jgi:hypothetical protein
MKKQDNVIEKTKIYLVENCYGDPNKVYIGKTINSRKNSHQQTYGKNIIYNELDEIFSSNKKDWEPLETYWIEQFRQWGFEVVNKRKKGGSGSEGGHKMPVGFGDKVKQRILGRKNYWVIKGKKGRTKTPIMQFDLKNNLIKNWSSQKQAAYELHLDLGTLTACLKGRQKTCGGFKWAYNPENNLKYI